MVRTDPQSSSWPDTFSWDHWTSDSRRSAAAPPSASHGNSRHSQYNTNTAPRSGENLNYSDKSGSALVGSSSNSQQYYQSVPAPFHFFDSYSSSESGSFGGSGDSSRPRRQQYSSGSSSVDHGGYSSQEYFGSSRAEQGYSSSSREHDHSSSSREHGYSSGSREYGYSSGGSRENDYSTGFYGRGGPKRLPKTPEKVKHL